MVPGAMKCWTLKVEVNLKVSSIAKQVELGTLCVPTLSFSRNFDVLQTDDLSRLPGLFGNCSDVVTSFMYDVCLPDSAGNPVHVLSLT